MGARPSGVPSLTALVCVFGACGWNQTSQTATRVGAQRVALSGGLAPIHINGRKHDVMVMPAAYADACNVLGADVIKCHIGRLIKSPIYVNPLLGDPVSLLMA